MIIRPGRLLTSKISNNPIKRTLKLVGLEYLSTDVTYQFHPAGAPPGNRHYLYINGKWTADGVAIDGTMAASGKVVGGAATITITNPTGTAQTFAVQWTDGDGTWTAFQLGFNRVLTAAEFSALSEAAFWDLILAGTGVSSGDCSAVVVSTATDQLDFSQAGNSMYVPLVA